MANDIDKTSPHYKGDFGSIYEVNKKFPTGGVAGDFVVIEGWAHYWNADRATWCVNAERDSYWDELITNIIEKFKLLRGATYMGVASLDTVPAKVIGAKMYYFATVAGTYKNFGDLVVPQGINVLYSENGSSWVNTTLLEVAQELGVSTKKVVSQKALNDALNLKANQSSVNEALAKKADKEEMNRLDDELAKKFDKESVVQESGEAEDKVMSQKAVSDKLSDLTEGFNGITGSVSPDIYNINTIILDNKFVKTGDVIRYELENSNSEGAIFLFSSKDLAVENRLNFLNNGTQTTYVGFTSAEEGKKISGSFIIPDNFLCAAIQWGTLKVVRLETYWSPKSSHDNLNRKIIEKEIAFWYRCDVVFGINSVTFKLKNGAGSYGLTGCNGYFRKEMKSDETYVLSDSHKVLTTKYLSNAIITPVVKNKDEITDNDVMLLAYDGVCGLCGGLLYDILQDNLRLEDKSYMNKIEADQNVAFNVSKTSNEIDESSDDFKVNHYKNIDGATMTDERFSMTNKIRVPAGKFAVVSASDIEDEDRKLVEARFIVVYNSDGTLNRDITTQQKTYFHNTTEEDVYVVFTIWNKYVQHMIEIKDNATSFAPKYSPHKIANIQKHANYERLDVLEDKQNSVYLKDIFREEMDLTIKSIREHTQGTCIVFNIITDNHIKEGDAFKRQTSDTFNNLKYLNKKVYSNAIVHLGDILDKTLYDNNNYDDLHLVGIMEEYLNNLGEINKLYSINGNHDGTMANDFRVSLWEAASMRREYSSIHREMGKPYYYVDYPQTKIRCIFLATPDEIDGNIVFGYSDRELTWIANVALNVEDGWDVLFFAHMAPFFTWYLHYYQGNDGSGIVNHKKFENICKAFNNHTIYTDDDINVDFSGSTSQIRIYICGHAHGDSTVASGESINGKDEHGKDYVTINNMPCPVVTLAAATINATSAMSNYNANAPSRTDRTVTQECWSTFVYRRDENKCYIIRFGAGEDMTIEL